MGMDNDRQRKVKKANGECQAMVAPFDAAIRAAAAVPVERDETDRRHNGKEWSARVGGVEVSALFDWYHPAGEWRPEPDGTFTCKLSAGYKVRPVTFRVKDGKPFDYAKLAAKLLQMRDDVAAIEAAKAAADDRRKTNEKAVEAVRTEYAGRLPAGCVVRTNHGQIAVGFEWLTVAAARKVLDALATLGPDGLAEPATEVAAVAGT